MKNFFDRVRFGIAPVVVLGALAAGGCREEPQLPPPPVTGFNLANELGAASAWSEHEVIDFGTPEARRNMIQGWANDELWGRTPFVWSLGETSSLRFFVAEQRDITLELSCWAFVAEGLPPQIMTILNNGREVASIELGRTFGPGETYQLVIPKTQVVQGENVLLFQYAYTAQAADHLAGNTDRRPLAVAWDQLRFRQARDHGEPRALVVGGHRVLELPFWSEVTYFLMLPPNGELELEGLTVWGGQAAEAHVEVTVEGRGEAPKELDLRQSAEPPGHERFPISYDAPAITRLTLRSRPGAGPGKGGIRLIEPAITSPDVTPSAPDGAGRASGESSSIDFGTPNILVYLIDALRADHLGCYGYQRPTSPNIDAFAAGATLFEHFVAQSSWTKSTMGSVFSGMGPLRHGANSATDILPEAIDTLAERVKAKGWDTAGFITNGVVSNLFGFDQGFSTYVRLAEDNSSPEIHQLSDRLNQEVTEWLDGRDTDRPFFVYVHASDPHAPYYPRDPYRDRFAAGLPPEIGRHDRVTEMTQDRVPVTPSTPDDLASLYDAEIAFNDASFGALIRDLQSRSLLDSTLVILMADHGEEFYDHGRWEHGLTLFGEQLHVPLIIRFPSGRWQGVRVPDTVQQVDILPTILDVVGAEPTPELEGRSLIDVIDAPADGRQTPTVISILDKVESRKVESVIWRNFKLIHYLVYDQPRPEIELYDLADDPEETRNLASDEPILVGYLTTLLAEARARGGHEALDAELDDEMRAQLEALGYLENGS